jgi:heat shock protein HslJ
MRTERVTRRLISCGAVAALLVAAGCGSSDSDPGTGSGTDPIPSSSVVDGDGSGGDAAIDGPWRAISGVTDGEAVELIDGRDVTMTIGEGTIGGTAACNSYGGDVAIGADGSFVVGEMSWTEMGCEPELMAVEQAFLAALGATTTFSLVDDTLTLDGAGDEWVFERLLPVEPAAIVGTTWVLDTVIEGDAASNSPMMELATLTLHEDGTLTGSTSCRQLTGEWAVTGERVQFTTFAAIDDPTAGVCATESQQLDGVIVTVLGDGFTPTVDGNRLTVMAQGGMGLSYTAMSEDPSVSEDAVADGPVAGSLDPAGGVDGPVVYGADTGGSDAEEALLTGELAVQSGCVVAGEPDGGGVTALLWPFGTRWQPSPPAVILPDGHPLAIGDTVELGGGSHGVDPGSGDPGVGWWTESDLAVDALRTCAAATSDGVFVVQSW